MNSIDEIKTLIADDKLKMAFAKLDDFVRHNHVDEVMKNRILLLNNQYNNFSHRKQLDLPINKEDRNRVVMSVLQLLSELEGKPYDDTLEKQVLNNLDKANQINEFFRKNKIPIIASGSVIVIIVSFNSLTSGIIIALLLLIITVFMWEEIFG